MATTNDAAIQMKDWMQRSTLDFFKRNEGAMMVPRTVLLSHDAVVKVMSKHFEVVSRDAHYITIASRLILADRVSGKIFQEEEVFKAETAVHAQFERVNDYLDNRIKQAEQKLSHAGVDSNTVERNTRIYQARCSTRTATDYLQLLVKADIYLAMVQYLWILGELSDSRDEALKAKLNTERDVRNHLFTITRTTTNHFNILRRICNGVLEERRAERAKQSERDKRKHAETMSKEQAQKEMDDLAKGEGGNAMPSVASDNAAPSEIVVPIEPIGSAEAVAA